MGVFQISYQVRCCSQDNGIHRPSFPSTSIFSTVCTSVSHPFSAALVLRLMGRAREYLPVFYSGMATAGLSEILHMTT